MSKSKYVNQHFVTEKEIMKDVRVRAKQAGLVVHQSLTIQEFMLNGMNALTYDYTVKDKALISSVFDALDSVQVLKGDAVYVLLFNLLSKTMKVKQYDSEIVVSDDSPDVFINEGLTLEDVKDKCYFDTSHERLLNYKRQFLIATGLNCITWRSQCNGYIIMNFDVKESLSALRMLKNYGVINLFLLEALMYSMEYNDHVAIDYRSEAQPGAYRALIKKLVINNNHNSLDLVSDCLQRIIFMKQSVRCPALSVLNKLPFYIVTADIDAGDFNTPHYDKQQKALYKLEDDENPIRKSMLTSLLMKDYKGYGDGHYDIFEWHNKPSPHVCNNIIDKMVELMNSKYDYNWSVLNESLDSFNNKDGIYDVFALLPYVNFPHYLAYRYASNLLYEVITNPLETERLKLLLISRAKLKKLWINVNGNGNNIINELQPDAKLELNPLSPRRYWSVNNAEHDLTHYCSTPSGAEAVNYDKSIPNKFLRYIRAGELPEEIQSRYWWWSIYKYSYSNKKLRIIYTLYGKNPLKMVFKLRTPESEDQWREWTRTLSTTDN